jgi:hypothetical protein
MKSPTDRDVAKILRYIRKHIESKYSTTPNDVTIEHMYSGNKRLAVNVFLKDTLVFGVDLNVFYGVQTTQLDEAIDDRLEHNSMYKLYKLGLL